MFISVTQTWHGKGKVFVLVFCFKDTAVTQKPGMVLAIELRWSRCGRRWRLIFSSSRWWSRALFFSSASSLICTCARRATDCLISGAILTDTMAHSPSSLSSLSDGNEELGVDDDPDMDSSPSSASGISSASSLSVLCTDVELSAAAACVLKPALADWWAPRCLNLLPGFTCLAFSDEQGVSWLSSPSPPVRLARASAAAMAAESDWSRGVEARSFVPAGFSGAALAADDPRASEDCGFSELLASWSPALEVLTQVPSEPWSVLTAAGFFSLSFDWPSLPVVSFTLLSASLSLQLFEVTPASFDASFTFVDLLGTTSSRSGDGHRFLDAESADCLQSVSSLMLAT